MNQQSKKGTPINALVISDFKDRNSHSSPEARSIGAEALPAAPEAPEHPPYAVCRVRLLFPAAARRLCSWPPPIAAKPLSTELFFAGYQHRRCVYGPRENVIDWLFRRVYGPANSGSCGSGS